MASAVRVALRVGASVPLCAMASFVPVPPELPHTLRAEPSSPTARPLPTTRCADIQSVPAVFEPDNTDVSNPHVRRVRGWPATDALGWRP